MRSLFASLALVITLAGTNAARADAIGPPPSECPPGSSPSSNHLGPYCALRETCVDPGGVCPGGGSCAVIQQCIITTPCLGPRYDSGQRPDAEPCVQRDVVGPCASDGSCERGVCTERHVCPAPSSGESGGCSCRAAGVGGLRSAGEDPRTGASALVLLCVLAVFLTPRLRAQRRSREHVGR